MAKLTSGFGLQKLNRVCLLEFVIARVIKLKNIRLWHLLLAFILLIVLSLYLSVFTHSFFYRSAGLSLLLSTYFLGVWIGKYL